MTMTILSVRGKRGSMCTHLEIAGFRHSMRHVRDGRLVQGAVVVMRHMYAIYVYIHIYRKPACKASVL
jgi:hypothetical protein